jgi:hypothetical protein
MGKEEGKGRIRRKKWKEWEQGMRNIEKTRMKKTKEEEEKKGTCVSRIK